MADKQEGGRHRPVFGAAVLVPRAPSLDSDAVHDALREVVALAGARVRKVDDPSSRGIFSGLRRRSSALRFEIAGVRLSIDVASRPLCDRATLHSFINPAIWRDGTAALVAHRAHVLISEDDENSGSGADAMFDRATAVTLAASAVAGLVKPDAVIWLAARNAVPMGTFGREMERFIDGQAPLELWVRWQVLPPPVQQDFEDGKLTGEALQPGVSTIGLAGFIGSEIVAPPSHCPRDMLLDQILALASGVIDENRDLKDGLVCHDPGSGAPVARLHLRPSGPYSERPYWELLPHPSLAPKPNAKGGVAESGDAQGRSRDGLPPPRLRLISRSR